MPVGIPRLLPLRSSGKGDKVMRNFCAKCVYIVILQFVLVAAGLSNTLTLDEQGEVFAETDRYQVRFRDGVLTHFHNKLTQETYTLPLRNDSNKQSGISVQYEERGKAKKEFINDSWGSWDVKSKRLSPLAVEVAYHSDIYRLAKTVRIRISIDARYRGSRYPTTRHFRARCKRHVGMQIP